MGFAAFAGIHYWFPKMYGKMYNFRLANIAFWIIFSGFNLFYFPQFIIGMQGMPRRYFDYLPQFRPIQFISTIGAYILVTGLVMMLINLLYARRKGSPAPANPWKGVTLEWQIPSPPPLENFEVIPEITRRPYFFDEEITHKQ
jgi:cytochrome c oxidase subunit 1